MLQNIFVSTYLDHTKETLEITPPNNNIEQFKLDVNTNPGFIFIYNTLEKKLYATKIKSMSMEHPDNLEFVKIKTEDSFIFIEYQTEFRSFSHNIMKYLYARKNKDEIGNIDKSIYSTFQKYNFSYSRPILYEEVFWKEFSRIEDLLDKNDFVNHILFEGLIVPPANENFKTYARLVVEDGEHFLTLTNDKMLEVDLQYIDGNYPLNLPSYKPYFYDFYPDVDHMLKSTLSSYDEEVFEVEFFLSKDEEISNKEFIKGKIVFSASPIKSVTAYIKYFSKNQDPKVLKRVQMITNITKNKIKTEKNKCEIERKILHGLVNHNRSLKNEIIIYNVGQGNWSKIDFKNKDTQDKVFSIVFDIGIGNKPPKDINEIAANAAQELEGNYMIMLSHWDQDHIKGIVHLEKKQFEKLWIVPALPSVNVSTGALRLAAFLYFDSTIESVFIDEKFNNQVIIDSDYLMLGKGEGRDVGFNAIRGGNQVKTSYNNKNNIGLILAVKNNNQKILLTGDCEYIQFPEAFIDIKYDFLVASHHGAKTNCILQYKCAQ